MKIKLVEQLKIHPYTFQCINLPNKFRNGSSIDTLDMLGGTTSLPQQLLENDSPSSHGRTSA